MTEIVALFAGQTPFATLHWNTDVPRLKLEMEVVEEDELAIVPFPLNKDQVPIPTEGFVAVMDVVEAQII